MSESEQAAGNLDNPPQDRKEKKQMEELWKRLNRETSQLEDAYKASGESLAVDGRIFGGQFDELETVLDQLEEQVKEEEKKAHMVMGQVDKIRADTSRVDNVARRIESMKRDDWQDIQKTIGYNTAWADGMVKWINLEGWRLSRGLQHRGINTASEMTTVLWEARMSLHSLRALLQLKEGSGFGKKLDETERMIERMVPKLRELLEKEGHPTAKRNQSDAVEYTALSPGTVSDPRPATSFPWTTCSSRTSCSQVSFPDCEILEGFQVRKHQTEQGKTPDAE